MIFGGILLVGLSLAQTAAAAIKGVVVAEVVIDISGNVSDARVVQSIPLLDDEALRAVRNWHFAPTMVNGQPRSGQDERQRKLHASGSIRTAAAVAFQKVRNPWLELLFL